LAGRLADRLARSLRRRAVPDLLSLSLPAAIGLFAASAAVIAIAGVVMANTADRLADRTGLGEAITGGVLLGASTSLSGFVTSVSTAAQGHPDLALGNAVGGITAQTFFLAIADIVYRRANLEHAAASITNLMQGVLLIALLSLPIGATLMPPWQVLGVHPLTLVVVVAYVAGVRLASQAGRDPLWGPKETPETMLDTPDEEVGGRRTLTILILRFLLLVAVVGLAGYTIGQAGLVISSETGMAEGLVGALLTAVSTSLPELVTTIAAVRRGALTLAVGGIIGGNTFDVLLVAASDAAYREGSIYHQVSSLPIFILAMTIVMTAVLLLGLLRREKYGIANIGFESVLLIVIYFLGTGYLVWVN
jgi:cation:H+ antiporter